MDLAREGEGERAAAAGLQAGAEGKATAALAQAEADAPSRMHEAQGRQVRGQGLGFRIFARARGVGRQVRFQTHNYELDGQFYWFSQTSGPSKVQIQLQKIGVLTLNPPSIALGIPS